MGHLMKIKCVDSRMNVHILASTSVPFTLTTVQVPNLSLTHTKLTTVCNGRAVLPTMTYCTAFLPAKELLSCKLLAIQLLLLLYCTLLNVHKTPTSPKSSKEGRGHNSMYSMTCSLLPTSHFCTTGLRSNYSKTTFS
jgi:hypothetical protein